MPEQYPQLVELRNKLEMHYGEVQDYEFTIEKGTLYCLQTRNGKMNAAAQVKTSVDLFREGLISRDRALLRIGPEILEQLQHSTLDPEGSDEPIPCGLPASPGAASGKFPPKYNESGILQDNPFEVLYVQGGRAAYQHGCLQWPPGLRGSQDRYLRRAWWPYRIDPVLPPRRPELRVMFRAAGSCREACGSKCKTAGG